MMDLPSVSPRRIKIRQSRRRLGGPQHVVASFVEDGNLEFETIHASVDLILSAADGKAKLAASPDDAWRPRLI